MREYLALFWLRVGSKSLLFPSSRIAAAQAIEQRIAPGYEAGIAVLSSD
jgi:hypothetical protein